ncbi:MAG: hypothetical protein MZV64_10015 [Ignavibacteriales bacterium]|nr:hypothetical protein [Ignavibacteriales bacterium]
MRWLWLVSVGADRCAVSGLDEGRLWTLARTAALPARAWRGAQDPRGTPDTSASRADSLRS